jgi:hypothetical protein
MAVGRANLTREFPDLANTIACGAGSAVAVCRGSNPSGGWGHPEVVEHRDPEFLGVPYLTRASQITLTRQACHLLADLGTQFDSGRLYRPRLDPGDPGERRMRKRGTS